MTEKALLACVRQMARLLGWRTYHTLRSVGSEPGFPDLVLLDGKRGRLIFVELKGPRGRLSPAQFGWLAELKAAGCEAYCWTPAEWHDGTIEWELRRAAQDAPQSITGPFLSTLGGAP